MRPERLRRSADIQRVRRAGATRLDAHFVVIALAGPEATPRLAVTAPARLGSAVRRNRVRRRSREAFRRALERTPAPLDLVVTARRAALEAPFDALVRSAETLLREQQRMRTA